MSRRRSAALRDIAGVHHVASRLAYEGFTATVARGSGAGADVLAGLPGSGTTAALTVRTAVCPPGFGGGEGAATPCEWRVGKGTVAGGPGSFVVLVDLGGAGKLPGVWVVPSAKIREHFARMGDTGPYRYRATKEDLAPHEDDWGAVEYRLTRGAAPQTGWFEKEELRELYGDRFVEALEAEASRLLGAHNSITVQMADGRFPAEDLADASALLSALFRRWMAAERRRRLEERRGGAA